MSNSSNESNEVTVYQILTEAGAIMGEYPARCPRGAIEAYCRDAGYKSIDAAADVDPTVRCLLAREMSRGEPKRGGLFGASTAVRWNRR